MRVSHPLIASQSPSNAPPTDKAAPGTPERSARTNYAEWFEMVGFYAAENGAPDDRSFDTVDDAFKLPAFNPFHRVPARLVYELGWDYAAHGLPLPEGMLHAENRDFEAGYRESVLHFGRRTKPHDRYVRKWLQLRLNAARRGRIVEAGVVPQYLKDIDRALCPVTRIELTHGQQIDTDWSIDRLLSNGAYCKGNLAVMSTRANTIKGSLSLTDVHDRVAQRVRDDRFTGVEWMRLYTMMLTANEQSGNANVRPITPLSVRPLPGQYLLPEHLIQFLIIFHLDGGEHFALGKLKSAVPFKAQKSFHRLVKRLRRQLPSAAARLPWEIFCAPLADPGTLKLVAEFLNACGDDWMKAHRKLLEGMMGGGILQDAWANREDFHLDTRGYEPPPKPRFASAPAGNQADSDA